MASYLLTTPSFLSFSSPPSRLHSNSLRCDCHLAWLSPWLRQRAALGLYTQCSSPPTLRGLNLAELRKSDFACSGTAAAAAALCATCGRTGDERPLQSLFALFPLRPRRLRLRSALQPGVRLLSSHVLLQQQHRGLSGEGPHRHPRPPARRHDRDVSSSHAHTHAQGPWWSKNTIKNLRLRFSAIRNPVTLK